MKTTFNILFASRLVAGLVVAGTFCGLSPTPARAQGALQPAGAPGPVMKTLQQLQPRQAITSLPVTIGFSGSFYLAGNLTGAPAQHGVTIAASDVTLDLNGFALTGLTNANSGVWVQAGCERVVVRNGTIRNWGQSGIGGAVGGAIRAERLMIFSNHLFGIWVINGGDLADCTITRNGAEGVRFDAAGAVRDCVISRNGGHGVRLDGNGLITDCLVSENSSNGVVVGDQCLVTGNRLMRNARGGTGAGLVATGCGNRITDNQVFANQVGLKITGTNNTAAANIVAGNTQNYDLAAGNQLELLICELPETIRAPAALQLAGTLTCGSTITSGITIAANDVRLDLRGHGLVGPGAGSGHGIYQADTYRNLRVENGWLRDWRGTAAAAISAAGEGNRFFNVSVISNTHGIISGPQSVAQDCIAWTNRTGFTLGAASQARSCIAAHNSGGAGFSGGAGCQFTKCVADNNRTGICAAASAFVRDCWVRSSLADGIAVGDGSTVNRCWVYDNAGRGIAGGKCTITECQVVDNVGYGISVSAYARVAHNHLVGSDSGDTTNWCIYTSSGYNQIEDNHMTGYGKGLNAQGNFSHIVRNTSRCSLTNYVISVNNAVGAIATVSSTFTNNNPWANFEF